MDKKQKTVLIAGLIFLGAVFIIATYKGIQEAQGNISQGISKGIQSISGAIAQDIKYIGVGLAIAVVSFLLLEVAFPISAIGFIAALVVPVYLFRNDSNNQDHSVTVTQIDPETNQPVEGNADY